MSPDQMLVLKALVERGFRGFFVYPETTLRLQLLAQGLTTQDYAVEHCGMSACNVRLANDYAPRDRVWKCPFHGPTTREYAAIAFETADAAMLKFCGFQVVEISPERANAVMERWSQGIQQLAASLTKSR